MYQHEPDNRLQEPPTEAQRAGFVSVSSNLTRVRDQLWAMQKAQPSSSLEHCLTLENALPETTLLWPSLTRRMLCWGCHGLGDKFDSSGHSWKCQTCLGRRVICPYCIGMRFLREPDGVLGQRHIVRCPYCLTNDRELENIAVLIGACLDGGPDPFPEGSVPPYQDPPSPFVQMVEATPETVYLPAAEDEPLVEILREHGEEFQWTPLSEGGGGPTPEEGEF